MITALPGHSLRLVLVGARLFSAFVLVDLCRFAVIANGVGNGWTSLQSHAVLREWGKVFCELQVRCARPSNHFGEPTQQARQTMPRVGV